MRRSDKQVFHVIFVLGHRSEAALAAAALPRVRGHRSTFDVSTPGNCDGYFLISDQVFDCVFRAFIGDFGPPHIAKILLHLFEFIDDHASQRLLVRKNLLEFRNQLDNRFVFFDYFLPFQSRDPPQLQIENGLRLDI